MALQEGIARIDQLVDVARGEDKAAADASEALSEGETESTGAAGDEDDAVFVGSARTRSESVGCSCGGFASPF